MNRNLGRLGKSGFQHMQFEVHSDPLQGTAQGRYGERWSAGLLMDMRNDVMNSDSICGTVTHVSSAIKRELSGTMDGWLVSSKQGGL